MWYPTVIYMQDWNGCSSLEQDNGSNGDRISITLTDRRDGNEYTVAKLKDGKCWMTQNLRIIDKTVYSSDTDMPNSSFRIPSSSYYAFTSSNINTAVAYLWHSAYGDSGSYNMYASTAGQTGSGITQSTQSICPRGWKIPTSSEYETMMNLYSVEALIKNPANFTPTGHPYNNYGSETNMASSESSFYRTSSSTTCFHLTPFPNPTIKTIACNNNYPGFGIRCMSR